jgi:NodT family efflux transporter outer membrane factor (OMF) lipoprotein
LYFAGVLTDRFLHVFSRAAGWLGCSWVVWMSGGCLSSPEAQTETLEVTVPAQWEAAASGEAFEPQAWVEDFSDPQLEALLEEALAHNFSLMAAAARRDAAVAGTVAARSSLWPTLGLEGSYNESSRQVGVDGGTSNDINTTSYGLSGRFAWEIDLWGRLRNGYRADLADAEAAQAEFEATRLSIAANTARAWYTAVEARLLLELAEQTLEAFLENERTVEEGFERGIGGALEVRLVRANVASARSAVEGTQRNLADALRAVELLLGRYPAAEIAVARTWPELTATVPAGLPTDLLLRRPDVVAAERNLAASQQRSYEARKAMLPNLTLSLSGGTSAASLGDITDLDAAQVWSQVWSLSQPLFQGGRLRAEAERNEALERQAVANYTQAVLVAFGEVEDTLDEQASYARDHAMTRLAAEESIEAGNLAWERYEAGLADIITALDADRRSINAQQALIQVTHRRIQSRINLYLALGGGFLSDDPPASPESLP